MLLSSLVDFDRTLIFLKNPDWPEAIQGISAIDSLGAGTVVFIKDKNFLARFEKSLSQAAALKIGAVLDERLYEALNSDQKSSLQHLPWLATSKEMTLTMTKLTKPFYDKKFSSLNYQADGRQMGTTDIDPTARISQNVFIGENVKIGPRVVIMPGSVIMPQVVIEEGTIIYPQVTIYPFSKIGQNCRIHSGVVIGSDGFGYTFHQGQHHKIWHMGGVEIGDDVEIGSNSSVDMGTFSPTKIGTGTRIDNLVQVAHNVRIGKGCILCGQSGVAGSAVLEDFVVLGGRAAVGPDVHLGMGAQIAGGAKVTDGHWPAGVKLAGHPARELREWLRGVAYLRKVSLSDKKE